MNAYFPVVNEHISKRNKKVRSIQLAQNFFLIHDRPQMIDYDAARSKLRKLIDKPSEDPTKLPRAQQEHDDAKEVFDLLNDQLISELPQLLDLRVPFFDPSFEAMIRMQCKFAEEGYEKMSGVQRYFEDSVRDDYAAGQLDAQVSQLIGFYLYSVQCGLPISGRGSLTRDEGAVDMWSELRLFSIDCKFGQLPMCHVYYIQLPMYSGWPGRVNHTKSRVGIRIILSCLSIISIY